jgi:hypothetical protein
MVFPSGGEGWVVRFGRGWVRAVAGLLVHLEARQSQQREECVQFDEQTIDYL